MHWLSVAGPILYLVVGFVVMVKLASHANQGMSVLDFVCCAFLSTMFPLFLVAVFAHKLPTFKAPWLTEVRYLKPKQKENHD